MRKLLELSLVEGIASIKEPVVVVGAVLIEHKEVCSEILVFKPPVHENTKGIEPHDERPPCTLTDILNVTEVDKHLVLVELSEKSGFCKHAWLAVN